MDEQDTAHLLPRRSFLALSWRAVGGLLLGASACHMLGYLASAQHDGAAGRVVTCGQAEDFASPGVTYFQADRFFLVRAEDGGFLALHNRCTHLSCVVNWEAAAAEFICPCHGSRFQGDGQVINPPAPRGLDRFAVSIERHNVLVDTRVRFQQDAPVGSILVYDTP